jgi:hypothetical protein
MSNVARSLMTAIVASALGLGAVGCSAAAGGEQTGSADEAFTGIIHLQCDLWAGNASHRIPAGNVTLRNGGYPGGGGSEVDAFVAAIKSEGGGLGYTVVATPGTSWYAIDVTYANHTAVSNTCVQYENTAPVYSGFYSCAASPDYPPPNGPYPHWIAAFDPGGCGHSCM